jgi:hypothetical protein
MGTVDRRLLPPLSVIVIAMASLRRSQPEEKSMNTTNEVRELAYEEVDAVAGGGQFICEMNAWDRWIYTYFFAPNEIEIH